MSVGRVFLITALWALLSAPASAQSIPILVDTFDGLFSASVWEQSNGGINVTTGLLVVDSNPSSEVSVQSKVNFAPTATLPLVLTVTVLQADAGSTWGLAVGNDRTNAIEFKRSEQGGILARTVANGVATETVILSGGNTQTSAPLFFYNIIVYPGVALFSINGQPVALHTTNVPAGALNSSFSVRAETQGHRLAIDYVSFSRR